MAVRERLRRVHGRDYVNMQIFKLLSHYQIVITLFMNSKYAETLQGIKNSSSDNQIPPFPHQAMQIATEQIGNSYNELKALRRTLDEKQDLSEDEKVFLHGKMVLKIDTIYRLKRFMLITLESRCKKIETQFWNFGGEIKKSEISNMSEKEKSYLLQYKNLVNGYIDDVGLELTMDLQASVDTVVEIKVLKDCGEIIELNEQGINLQKNSVHFIKRRLIEKLLRKGDVVIIG